MSKRGKEKIGVHCILAAAYFLMIPLSIAASEANFSFLKLLTVPIGIFFVANLVFYRKEFKINVIHLFLAFYTVVTFLALAVSFNTTSMVMVLGYVLNAVLFICISVVEYNQKELQFLEDIQVVLLVILIAIPFVNGVPDGQRTKLVIGGQSSDPNFFVGFFIFPLAVTLKKICESKWRPIYIVLVALSLYVILLTGSRGGLIAIVVLALAFALIYPKGLSKKLLVLGAITVFAVIFWTMIIPYLPDHIVARFSIEDVIESKGTHRVDIWLSMFREIKNSSWEIVFGRGLDALHIIFLEGEYCVVGAHNQMIMLMYTQGLVGVVAFTVLVVACVGRCLKRRKCVAIAMIGMMGLSLSLSFNTNTKTFWNLIPYAAFAFTEVGNKKDDEEDAESEGISPIDASTDTEISIHEGTVSEIEVKTVPDNKFSEIKEGDSDER